MGFSFSSSNQKNSSNSNANTYVDQSQQPYLDDIRSQAQTLNSQGMPVEGVARLNQTQLNAMGMANQGGQMQVGAGANLMGQGSGMTQGSDAAFNYASNAMGGTAQGGINTAMSAGNNYAGGAANSNAAFNNGINMNNVGNYINNDIIEGQIDSASRDVMRNLTENQIPMIASNAAGTGNSGSSRAGIAEGVAIRGAGDRVADISTAIRAPAYNTALNIGANQASQNAGFQQQVGIGNQNAYNSARQFGTGVGANSYNSNVQNQQFGAGVAQQIGQQGVNNMQVGQGMMNTGIGMAQGAGDQQRAYIQQLLGNQYQQAMAPYNSLNFYNSVVGAPNNLSTATSNSSGSSKSGGFGFG